MNYNQLLPEVQAYIRSFFASRNDARYVYHNLNHTESVVQAAARIANHFQLDERDFFTVIVAAWFHDTGYFLDAANHEAESARLATSFLEGKEMDPEITAAVRGCILATRLPQTPHTLPECIVCDADLFHLGTEDFSRNNKFMHKEAEAVKGTAISNDQWRAGTIRLLESHHYHTDYCRLVLDDTKDRNLQKLRDKSNKQRMKTDITSAPPPAKEKNENGPDKKSKNGKKRPEKGIETMFRITSSNNQRLSNMADNKAHIMITVNSIILSAIISLLLRKLDSNAYLAIPTYIILAVCVITIIFSILATRPSLPKGKFTEDDIAQKRVNLLFFGNFYKMSLADYTSGMLQIMEDRDFLYGSLIKDVYAQGIVLGRKYRLLRISYNVFMFGLIISVMAFIVATLSAGK